jgi:nucleoside-diphosphate-sugar epimerase
LGRSRKILITGGSGFIGRTVDWYRVAGKAGLPTLAGDSFGPRGWDKRQPIL